MKTLIQTALIFASLQFCALPTSAATKTWNGSTVGSWQIASNWIPAGVPVNGDTLVFPANAIKLLTTNAPGGPTNFSSLTLLRNGYELRGPALTITNGVTNSMLGQNTIFSRVTAARDATWLIDGTLVLATNLAITNVSLDVIALGTLSLDGPVNGNAGSRLVKLGSGFMSLRGGGQVRQMEVNAGELFVGSTLNGTVTVATNGTLTGSSGAVSSVVCEAGGMVAPKFGELKVLGSPPVFEAGATLRVHVSYAATTTTNHDTLSVPGPFDLSSVTLQVLSIDFNPTPGRTFVIVTNTGAGAFTNTFPGLPEGTFIKTGNVFLRLTYVGGDGNDIALINLPAAWDGGGNTFLWSTRQNWVGDAVPAAGADIYFPPSMPRTSHSNDFAADRLVGALHLGDGYAISGARIRLSGGVYTFSTNNPVLADPDLSLPLLLVSNQTFSVSNFTVDFLGAITNGGNTLTVVAVTNASMRGGYSGSGGLIKRGPRVLSLGGTNTYTGPTVIEEGDLTMLDALALGGTAGGTTLSNGGRLILPGSPSLVSESLELGGTLSMPPSVTNRWNGPITVPSGGGRISLNVNARLELDAPISGPGGLTLSAGTVAMLGNASYAGPTTNTATLEIHGNLSASEVSGSGTVSGVGSVRALRRPGAVAPGTNSTGVLTVTGDADLTGTSLRLDINGSIPGSQHDALHVAGAVALLNTTLFLQPTSNLPIGDTMTLLRVGGAAPANGNFRLSGGGFLPEGSFVTNNGNIFRLTYAGGDGNDIAVTVVRPPSIWTGLGADNFWTTPENWLSNGVPVAGSELIFPPGAARLANTNNFPPNTAFPFITVSGTNYVLAGASIVLQGELFDQGGGTNRVIFPMEFSTAGVIRKANGEFICDGAIAVSAAGLRFPGAGRVFVNAGITGPGSIVVAGAGTVEFGGSSPNTYTGPTLVELGFLRLRKVAGLPAVSTSLSIGNSNGTSAQVQLLSSNQIPDQATVNVGRGAIFSLGAGRETFATLALTDGRVQATSGQLTITNRIQATGVTTGSVINASLFLAGGGLREVQVNSGGTNTDLTIDFLMNSADGTGLRKTGDGRFLLSANGVGVSRLQLEAGETLLNGNWPDVPVTMPGGKLGGIGSCGVITASGGSIAPGTSPGILTTRGGVWSGTTQFHIELNGTNAGTGHDQLVAQGGLNLGGISLHAQVSGGFTPRAGDRFTIIRGTTAPITNTFAAAPEGSLLNVSGAPMRITYRGGLNARDVVLTVVTFIDSEIVRLPNGTVQFDLVGVPGQTAVIEATTNLLSPPASISWVPIATNTLDSSGVLQFIDSRATNFPHRFYRMRTP